MIKIKRAKLRGWCQHRDTISYDFAEGTTGIVGSNGRGKSNFINAVFTALTGRTESGTLEENINYRCDAAVIEVEFESNGVAAVVRREFKAPYKDGRRQNMKSAAVLTYGDEKVSGSAKVTAAIEDLTGMTPQIAADHVFISQDRLVALLFQTKAERMKSFMTLLPELSQTEPLRTALAAEAGRFPDVEVVGTAAAKADLATVGTEIGVAEEQLEAANTDIAAIDSSAAQDVVSRYQQMQRSIEKLSARRKQLVAATQQRDDAQQLSALLDTKLTALQERVNDGCDDYKASCDALSRLDLVQQLWAEKQSAEAELQQQLAAVQQAKPPDDGGKPWLKIPELETQYNDAAAQYRDAKKMTDLCSGCEPGPVECPTCGNSFSSRDELIAEYQPLLESSAAVVESTARQIQQLRKAETDFNVAAASYKSWAQHAQQTLQRLQARLIELGSVEAIDPDVIARHRQTVQAYTALQQQLRDAEQQSQQQAQQAAVAQQSVTALQDEIADITLDNISSSDYDAAAAALQRHSELLQAAAAAAATLSAKTAEAERLKTQIAAAEKQAAQAEGVRNYRRLLDKARDILHRDNLPRRVLQTRITSLNDLTNKYLELFGNPFAITIGPDMDITFVMPDGYKSTSAGRLSGGQKCVLSVAFRFAINDMFARDMGLLVLDEPTAWMDDDNIDYVGEVVRRAQVISASSGMQTVIITHAKALIPSFEGVIDLNEQE